MKQFILFLLILGPFFLFGKTTISGKINQARENLITLHYLMDEFHYPEFSIESSFQGDTFQFELSIEEPTFVSIKYSFFEWRLLVFPNQDIKLTMDGLDVRNTIQVDEPVNQFYLRSPLNKLFEWRATELELSAIETILKVLEKREREQQRLQDSNLEEAAHKFLLEEINYYFLEQILRLTSDYNAHDRTLYLNEVEGMLTNEVLNNPAAVRTPAYNQFLNRLPLFYYEHVETIENLKALKEKVAEKVSNSIQAIREGKMYYAWQFFKDHLEGAALEKALANLIFNWDRFMTTIYTMDVYNDFLARFPESKYDTYLAPKVATIKYYHEYWTSYPEAKQELAFKENTPATLEELIQLYPNQALVIHIWPSFCINCEQRFMYLPQYYSNEQLSDYKFVFLYYSLVPNQLDQWKASATTSRLKGDHYYVTGSMNREDDHLVKNIFFNISQMNSTAFVRASTLIVDKEGSIYPDFAPPFTEVAELTELMLETLK